jgi:NAD(P)-dependent dehydrogenase (short-subunit alcohol dehydrogenase family)
MDLELQERRALVSGGSRGIGLAIATELARQGARVAISARTREDLDAAAAAIRREGGGEVVVAECDTRDSDQVARMAESVRTALGGLDILVNCAAQPGGYVHELVPGAHEALGRDLDTKVLGYLRCIEAVVPTMRQSGWGRIVNIAGLAARSSASLSGMRNLALVHLGKTISDQLGAFGITVNTVHPGATRTERTEAADARRIAEEHVSREEIERERAASTAIGRMVDAREVGWLVAFLCSPKAAAITGESIGVGGGVGHSVFP